MEWDGKTERRKMDRDWVERDRLLSKIDANMDHLVTWSKEHNEDDNRRFALVTRELEAGKKLIWSGVGVVAASTFIIEFIIKILK